LSPAAVRERRSASAQHPGLCRSVAGWITLGTVSAPKRRPQVNDPTLPSIFSG
jgi:hypothetical protein